MKRLFLAIALDQDLASRLSRVAPDFEEACGPLTPHTPDDLHLTLSFLGDVDEEELDGVIRSAAEEFRGVYAPELELTGDLELLPLGSREPRVLTAPVAEVGERLGRLAALRNRAQQVGLSRRCATRRGDRRTAFRPHVTLARLRSVPPAPVGPLHSGLLRSWVGSEVALYESLGTPGPDGGRYRQLMAWGLPMDAS